MDDPVVGRPCIAALDDVGPELPGSLSAQDTAAFDVTRDRARQLFGVGLQLRILVALEGDVQRDREQNPANPGFHRGSLARSMGQRYHAPMAESVDALRRILVPLDFHTEDESAPTEDEVFAVGDHRMRLPAASLRALRMAAMLARTHGAALTV